MDDQIPSIASEIQQPLEEEKEHLIDVSQIKQDDFFYKIKEYNVEK